MLVTSWVHDCDSVSLFEMRAFCTCSDFKISTVHVILYGQIKLPGRHWKRRKLWLYLKQFVAKSDAILLLNCSHTLPPSPTTTI